MDFPKKQQQCLIPRYLLQYLQDLQISHNDPTAPWGGGGGGGSYTAGNGIDITNDVISIDNTVALKTDIPSLTGYATEDWVSTELLDYAELSDLATVATTGDYNDLINKPTIPVVPTNISAFINDSGYITSSALTGYATETWVTSQRYATADWVYDRFNYWIQGYATEQWVTNQGYSTFSGSYNDLTNKPTIPTVPTNVSAFTNDSGYITLTKLNEYLSTYVTTGGDQNITGTKTFVGAKKIAFKPASTADVIGFTAYNQNNAEVGNLQVANRGTNGMYVTLGNYSNLARKARVGFRLQPDSSTNSFNFIMPYGNYSSFISNGYSASTDTTIPCSFTDGTTKIKADATGLVNISSLLPTVPTNVSAFTNDAGYITGITSTDVTTALGYTPGTSNFSGSYSDLTDKPTIPDAVSGTNDGTNWTSLTIGSDTYGIPSGGGSAGPTITRYTGYASYPITYAVPSGQDQYSYMYISIYSSELSGFLNYDNVNPGDILYINTTLGYTSSDNVYRRSSKLFTVSVPPKPDSTYPTYTISTDDPADGNVSGLWACSTVNRITNTQETTASNIVKTTAIGLDATNNFYIRVPLWSRSSLTITLTVDSITHVAF